MTIHFEDDETRYFERTKTGQIFYFERTDESGRIVLKDLNGSVIAMERGQFENLYAPVDEAEAAEAFRHAFPAPVDSKHGREIAMEKARALMPEPDSRGRCGRNGKKI